MSCFIFLDIETTGLDPINDQILEVYAIPVGFASLLPIGDDYHAVVGLDPDQPVAPEAAKMHVDTGLVDVDPTHTTEELVETLSAWLAKYPRAVLVGRNVGTFDRRCLEEAGVDLGPLHYHNFDMSTILRLFSTFRPQVEPPTLPRMEGTKHRAKDDVLHDLETLQVLADWLEDR